MFNCGMVAIELSKEQIDNLFKNYAGHDTTIKVDIDSAKIFVSAGEKSEIIDFKIGGFDKTLVQEGGWVNYADNRY
jgi:3-isopropylmalate/(R)-2-methylmalate dehydratase small subunit